MSRRKPPTAAASRQPPPRAESPSLVRINHLNSALIVLAAAVAAYRPLETLVIAYAVLGPLHYLTEIVWLRDRRFFASSPNAAAWLLIPTVPFILETLLYFFPGPANGPLVASYLAHAPQIAVVLSGLAVVAAVAFATRQVHRPLLVAFVGVVIGLLATRSTLVTLATYCLLPTFIHVFVFTGLFLIWGARRQASASASITTVFYFVAPCALALLPDSDHVASPAVDAAWRSFHLSSEALLRLSQLAGCPLSTHFIARWLAFAYLYHYLNWFSKTGVIRWHESTAPRLSLVTIGYVVSLALFLYDYQVGLMTTLSLSAAHVFLELPLNVVSFQGLFRPAAANATSTARD